MKVRGTETTLSPRAYARLVADHIATRLAKDLANLDDQTIVLPPREVADRLSGLVLNVSDDHNELAALIGPCWTSRKVRDALDIPTRQALESRRKAGSILGLRTTDGTLTFPVAQFETHDGTVRVKSRLRPLLKTLREHDPWSVAVLLHTPAEELGGYTPLDWSQPEHDPQALQDLAKTVAAEWAI